LHSRERKLKGRFLGAALFLCGVGGGLLDYFIKEATADFVGPVTRSPEGEHPRLGWAAGGAAFPIWAASNCAQNLCLVCEKWSRPGSLPDLGRIWRRLKYGDLLRLC
jgi:hypothetical protein